MVFLSLMESLFLLLETLQRSNGPRGEGVLPAERAAWAVVSEMLSRLQLVPQEAHRHLQDVGFLQLGVWLLLVKLLLQDDFELLDAGVNAIPAHFLHQRFSQLQKET